MYRHANPGRLLAILAALAMLLAACAPSARPAAPAGSSSQPGKPAQLEKATMRLDWFPKGIHAIFWLGKEKGYYEQAGLDLSIQTGDGSGNTTKLVGSGEFQFGFADGPTMLVGRTKGIPVVSLGVVHQKNPQVVVYLTESGMRQPKDLEGRVMAVQPQASTYPAWLAFAQLAGIDRGKLREVNTPGEVPAFILEKKADASMVVYDNEYITIEDKAGGASKVGGWLVYDYGYKGYGHVILTNENMIKQKPAQVRAFVQATRQAMDYAMKNQQEAIDILLKHFPDLDRAISARQLQYGAERLFTSPESEQHGLLWQTEERWTETQNIMYEYKLAETKVEVSGIFTNEYLQ